MPWCVDPEHESASTCSCASSRLLEWLPDELLGLVLRHASGTADIDAYLDGVHAATYQLQLGVISDMICERSTETTHVCRRWRQILAPAFYHYAVYDGSENYLMVPDGNEHYIRWLLIHVPDGASEYSNILQSLYRLPREVRSRILRLGLHMGERIAMSTFEYGPLAAAFPGLQQIWLEMGRHTTGLHSVYPAGVGSEELAPVTTLVLQDMLGDQLLARLLVSTVAATLTHLDLVSVSISAAREVLWSPYGPDAESEPLFPQLLRLFVAIDDVQDRTLPPPSRACPFPKLEVLVCRDREQRRSGSAAAPHWHNQIRSFVAMLLKQVPVQLRKLSIDDLDGDVPEILSGKMLQLEELELFHGCQLGGSGGSSLGRVLQMAAAMPELRVLATVAPIHSRRSPLDESCPCLPELRVLDIARRLLTLSDLELLLSRLPRLVEMRATLTEPQAHPVREDIRHHMAMQQLWIGSDRRPDAEWDDDSFESLTTMLVRMPRLTHARMFRDAVNWQVNARADRSRVDLQHLAMNVYIDCCGGE